MSPATPTVHVVTAEAGEPQLVAATASLEAQQGVEWHRTLISGRSMRDALEEIHAVALRSAGEFDWVIKLDGDMVLSRPTALADLVKAASAYDFPRYTEPVEDWYTDRQVEGVHLLRSDAIPMSVVVEPPFNDQWISQLPGVVMARVRHPAVIHAPDPNHAQALRFGLQRGIKALAQGPASVHWRRIDELQRKWNRSGEPVLLSALAGAALGLRRAEVGDPIQLLDPRSPAFDELASRFAVDPSAARGTAGLLIARRGAWRVHLDLYGAPRLAAANWLRAQARDAVDRVKPRRSGRRDRA